MKTPKAQSVIRSIAVLAALILASSPAWPWPPDITPEQAAALQPLDPTAVPRFGTFWLLFGPNPGKPYPPLPCPPGSMTNVLIYALDDRHFLVDDSAVDYAALQQQREIDKALRDLEDQLGLAEPMGTEEGGGPLESLGYPSNSLWLSISQITNGLAPLTIHGTTPDVTYEILSRQTLTNVEWFSEGFVPGSADQDWTPTAVEVGARTNSLFLSCRSWEDSNGSGIPDWWLLQYFGTTDIDPYTLCPSGDGWTVLQACQNGWNPLQWHTPPPPRNVVARVDSTGTNVTLTWESGGGPVTNYVIEAGYWGYGDSWWYPVGEVGPSTFTASLTPDYPLTGTYYLQPAYQVRACFSDGASAVSASTPVFPPEITTTAFVVRGAGGHLDLAVSALPDSVTSLRLFADDPWGGWPGIDLPASNILNGVMTLPDAAVAPLAQSGLCLQAFTDSGAFGNAVYVGPVAAPEGQDPTVFRFTDASSHLKENLKFLLCSATVHQPFSCGPGDAYWGGYFESVWKPETYFARPSSPASYEYYGFHTFSSTLNYSVMQELRPAQKNHLWRNLAYDPGDFNAAGQWTNGVGYEWQLPGFRWLYDPNYQLTCTNCDPLPLALSVTNYPFLYARWVPNLSAQQFSNDLAEIGVGVGDTNIYLLRGVVNAYGLPLEAVLLNLDSPLRRHTLTAGGPTGPRYHGADYFCAVEAPILQTVDYYFASQTPYFYYGTPRPPLPGSPDFNVTNTSPLLMTGFGQSITVCGWAKQAITNGYSGTYAYLEQYFDQACTVDTSGVATTNSAGLLSPYGEFFRMQPGPAALVTMPDIDTGQQGTGIVHVIKLQLDVNHDGTMDLSFAGPDNTSQARPFVFWVNNDHDGTGVGADAETNRINFPDCTYGTIHSERNLEDFARLWVCGVPPLSIFQTNYAVTLSLQSTRGTPAIRLYWSCETDGGIRYLTNANVAAQQVAASLSPHYGAAIATVSNNAEFTFPEGAFVFGGTQHLLFETAGVGSGALMLTISQGTNILCQTSAWLDLHDIKDLYEQALVTNVVQEWPAMVEQDTNSGFRVHSYATANTGEASQLAVFLHGWRVPEPEYFVFAETMFKRLYWQGFQGRFASLRWPTRSADTDPFFGLDYATYNRSEHIAFKSGTGTAAYLSDLRLRFPDDTISVCAHSMGNIVMMQALRELTSASQAPIDNYVLMQAAVPAQCYDSAVTNLPAFESLEQTVPTPNTYSNYADGISAALRGGGQLLNFFNPGDFALTIAWEWNQKLYLPVTNGPVTMKPNTLLGYYTDAINHEVRTNWWNQSLLSPAWGGYYNGPTRSVTNAHEIMPFVARPRTKAVGAQAAVQGQIEGAEVNLQSRFGFGGGSSDHSAQWNRSIQDPAVAPFYSQLRTSLFPIP